MRTKTAKPGEQAITLIEALLVIAILFIIASMLLPGLAGSRPSPGIRCLSNLRQNLIGLEIWQTDHSNALPWQISMTNGGTMESALRGNVSENFRVLLGCGANQTTFICPLDKSRRMAESNALIADQNISYFLNLNADTKSPTHSVVSGDRNLQADGKPVKPGLFNLKPEMDMNWTRELHMRGGYLAFADGHVEFCKTNQLAGKWREQGMATSQLLVP